MTPEFIILILIIAYGFIMGLLLHFSAEKLLDIDEVAIFAIAVFLANAPLVYMLLFTLPIAWIATYSIYSAGALAFVLYLPWHTAAEEETITMLMYQSVQSAFLVFFPSLIALIHIIAS